MALEQPTFGWTVLYVDNVDAAIEFYTGCGLPLRFRHESGTYAELETGATALALCDREFVGDSIGLELTGNRVANSNITLVVEDVPAMFNHAIALGATSVHEPVTKPWGQVSGYVFDPDHNLIEFATAMSS